MRIFRWDVSNTSIVVVVGAVLGGGACYAILKYFLRSETGVRKLRRCRLKRSPEGEPDQTLPLVLEQEYGNFRQLCDEADPISARYLQEIPDHFFAFPKNFLGFISNFVGEHTQRFRQALVVGSRTGFLTFALGTIFDEVKGVERSFSQVVTCYQFQNLKAVTHNFPSEGVHKSSSRTFNSPIALNGPFIPERGGGDIRKRPRKQENVEFINADLDRQSLALLLGEFQVVILQNCLEDLKDPVKFLESVKNVVAEDGFLIISSIYEWNEELKITKDISDPTSFGMLKQLLHKDFKLEAEKNIAEILCESLRSCHIRNNHVTAWSRRLTNNNAKKNPRNIV